MQVVGNISFLVFRGGALNGKPYCARGVKQLSSGVKHFLKGVKKNLGGGFNPLTPRKSAHESFTNQSTDPTVFHCCFSGPGLMMHPELQIDAHTLDPLLKPQILRELKEMYVLCQ